MNLRDAIRGQADENMVRKDFTPSEAVAIWQAMESYQLERDEKGRFRPSESDGRYRQQRASKLVGLSTDSLSAKQVVDSGDRALIEEMDRTDNISATYRKLRQKQRQTKILPLPAGQYDVIYADPPWRYDFDVESRATENHYATLTVEEICHYQDPQHQPIQKVFAENAILFLWTTVPKAEEAFHVIRAWGFVYKTQLVWSKDKIGLGWYVRNQHEVLYIAEKGNMPVPEPEARISSVIYAPRTEHSRKPDVFYEIIEKMYPNRKYLELFGRRKRPGWETWGNAMDDRG